MVVYAENAGRRAMQVVADLTVTVITLVIWRGARATHDLVAALGAPGRRLADTGTRLGAEFNDFAEAVGATPLAGGALRAPIDALAGTSAQIAGVGTAQDAAAGALADWLGALVLLPAIALVVTWLVLRVRRARQAHAARELRDRGGSELLALRAIATQPLRALAAAGDDPVADWRAGRVDALAGLELRRLGLRATAGEAS